MARGKYSEDGSRKLCKGRTHPPGGEYVHVSQFHVHKAGRLAGRPFYVCKPCWNVLRGKQPDDGMISWDEAWPVINRLIEHFGSKAEVVRQLGRHQSWLYEIRKYPSIRRAHFLEARDLLRKVEALQRHHGQGQAEVVRAEPLGTVLRGWVQDWLAERPLNQQPTGQNPFDDKQYDFMGPIQLLHEKTEINPRRITGIINGEFEFIGVSQADALLTAAGMWDLITLGEIEVIPNPNWSMEKWQSYMSERGCA